MTNNKGSYRGSKKIKDEARRLNLISEIANEEAERVLLNMKNSGFSPRVICDFGCGTGDAFSVLQKVFPRSRIFGVDQSETAASLAKENNKDVQVFKKDMNLDGAFDEIGQQTGPIDLAFFRNVLLHIPKPSMALEKAKEQVKKNGFLFAQEPDWSKAEGNWQEFSVFVNAITKMMQSVKINPYIGRDMEGVFKNLDLKDVEVDVSRRKVIPKDTTWEILYYLLEVAGEGIDPYLQERGIKSRKEMKQRMEVVRGAKGNYYYTPAWFIATGRVV